MANNLYKGFEDNIISASALLEENVEVISVSPSLNLGLGGGISEGTVGVLTGHEKCGKTTTALQIAANACQANPNRKIIYEDIENRLRKKNLMGIHNLDVSRMEIIRSTKDTILTAESHCKLIEQKIIENPFCIMIIDSISAMCSQAEFDKDYGEMVRGGTGALQSKLFKRLANIGRPNKAIIICMTHLGANVSGYGSPWVEKTSRMLAYGQDWKIMCKSKPKEWEEGTKKIGQIVKWEIINSDLGGNGSEVESYIRYGHGVDEIMEYATIAIDLNLIEAKGAWCTINFGPDQGKKLNGKEKVREYLSENPEAVKELDKMIKEML